MEMMTSEKSYVIVCRPSQSACNQRDRVLHEPTVAHVVGCAAPCQTLLGYDICFYLQTPSSTAHMTQQKTTTLGACAYLSSNELIAVSRYHTTPTSNTKYKSSSTTSDSLDKLVVIHEKTRGKKYQLLHAYSTPTWQQTRLNNTEYIFINFVRVRKLTMHDDKSMSICVLREAKKIDFHPG